MPAPLPVNPRPFPDALLRWGLRISAALVLLCVLALAGVYVFLQRDPEALIRDYLEPLQQKTGLQFRISSVDVTLLPLPALTLSGLSVTGSDLSFTAERIAAAPGFMKLLRLDLIPGSLLVKNARLNLKTDLPLAEPSALLEALKLQAGGAGLRQLPEIEVIVEGLSARIEGASDSALVLSDCNADVDLMANGELGGKVAIPALNLMQGSREVGGIGNIALAGKANLYDFANQPAKIDLSGAGRYGNIFKIAHLKAIFDKSGVGWTMAYDFDADLDLASQGVPLVLAGSASQIAPDQKINVSLPTLKLGRDFGSLMLGIALPEQGSAFSVAGSLQATRLSLTEWMGWARILPPGLQIALDDLTDASATFKVDENGLVVSGLAATCAGAHFSGDGGVPDWKKPVVELNLYAPTAVLEAGVPEALGQTPAAPVYLHPPLTPLPTEPLLPGEAGIGYKINLGAGKLGYGSVTIQDVALLVHPGQLDKNGFHDVLLDGKGIFYGGKISGRCILGAHSSLPYHISSKADNVNAALLAADLKALPLRSGIFDGQATVTSRGKTLSVFLGALKGDLSVSGEKVRLDQKGTDMLLPKLLASLRLRSGAWNGSKLSMDGIWRVSAAVEGIDLACDLDGKLAFGADGMSLRNLPGEIRVSGKANSVLSGRLKGAFSADSGHGRFEVRNGRLEALGETVQCDAVLDTGKKTPLVQGSLKTAIKNINALLARLGIRNPAMPTGWNELSLAADFNGTLEQIKLAKIQARAGKSRIEGALGWDFRKMHLEADLAADTLNLDSMIGKGDKNAGNWDFPGLARFGASGQIRSRDLVLWDLRFVNASVPFALDRGRLHISKASANFCGGPVTAHANADFNKGTVFDASLSVKNFNLTQAARDRRMETRFTGSASAQIKIGAKLAGSMKLLPALDGQWAISINQGSWQTADKDGKLKGSPTSFQSLKCSGNLRNGIVRSDNLTLTGKSMDVVGGGQANLVSRKVDCVFNVDINGLPEFPLRLYGTLDKPETSIGAAKLALNAISGVATGFAGLFKGLWGVFIH